LWTVSYSGSGSPTSAQRVVLDASGDAYVAGSEIWAEYPNGGGTYVGRVAVKYDPAGNLIWATLSRDNSAASAKVEACALDAQGNFDIVSDSFGISGLGCLAQQFSATGSNTWNAFLSPHGTGLSHDLKMDANNNVLVACMNDAYPPNYTYTTFKIAPNGIGIWTNNYPQVPVGTSVGEALSVDSANNVYVTGYSPFTTTSNDIVTIKYAPNGNQIWLQRYNGPGNGDDEGNAIAVDNNGNVYVAGYETETNGFTEMVLIKYSPVTVQKQSNGNFILQAYGSPGENFNIQASTNLQTWQDIGRVVADTNGLVQFSDTNASNFNGRFYYTVPQ
jgi:hypothetical protein